MSSKPVALIALIHLGLGGLGGLAGLVMADPPPPAAPPPAPCAAAENRQFDFWVGEWEVRDPAGDLAGLSQVSAILDGCVILERWQGQGKGAGFDGQSFNTLDPRAKSWSQHWVDNAAGSLLMTGGFRDGRMVLQSGVLERPTGPQITRITWEAIDADHVRQHVERSKDEAKTWTTMFDGRYSRRKPG